MSALRLSDADFAAFRDMLDNPPSPGARLRRLMREPARLWNETVSEPIDEFLAILSGLSDEGAGSGGATSGRLTRPESDIRHCDHASLSIGIAHDAQSHNLNAPLSTRSASGGSDA